MKKSTLDTNIITAFLKNNSRVVKKIENYLKDFDRLSINIITYYEILRGLRALGNREKLKNFEAFIENNEIIHLTKTSIEKAAEIYAYLKKRR